MVYKDEIHGYINLWKNTAELEQQTFGEMQASSVYTASSYSV